ncbi:MULTISPECIES: thioredoxin family protein [Flavobacteriaceae]|uniref:thioredoxin family protein n=1 Tax=Flavobacteriaceae TaxID=49546 RepID=UPI00234B6D0C|nr:thioredoxin family protein [Muricauda sp. SP22]MDC6364216.1 thioredoxin family protein [Muricauda sp. SP22]
MELLEKKIEEVKITLVKQGISMGMDYEKYRDLVHHLADTKQTTGLSQSEANIEYTQLNDRRMRRWDKTFKLPEAIGEKVSNISSRLKFLVLTESWCGDAAHSMPIMNKIAEANPNIDFKALLRDENPELMDAFLTNGSRSIPKLVVFDADLNEIIAEWGPRPSIATQMANDYKAMHGTFTPEFKQDLQVWYNKDKGESILEEIVALLPLK